MTPEQKRRLDMLIWSQRLKVLVPSVIVVLLLLGGFAWMSIWRSNRVDRIVENHIVVGKVTGIARLAGRRSKLVIHVHLADGNDADATTYLVEPPAAGKDVELRAATHASGQVTYSLVRLID